MLLTCLFDLHDLLDPGHDFVGGRVGRLVQVDNSVFKMLLNRSLHGVISLGNGSEVVGSHVKFVDVLKKLIRDEYLP
jgi:hypothetical protein